MVLLQRLNRRKSMRATAKQVEISSTRRISTPVARAKRSWESSRRAIARALFLTTKYSNAAAGNDPNAAGNHRKSMMQAVEASLKRLQTDYIHART